MSRGSYCRPIHGAKIMDADIADGHAAAPVSWKKSGIFFHKGHEARHEGAAFSWNSTSIARRTRSSFKMADRGR